MLLSGGGVLGKGFCSCMAHQEPKGRGNAKRNVFVFLPNPFKKGRLKKVKSGEKNEHQHLSARL